MAKKENNILLETGTNELEILEFTVAGNRFGINVGKITELVQALPVQHMPHSHPCVEGVVKPRDVMYTVVDLAQYLGLPPSPAPEKDIFIISHFNRISIAFHVHGVESIHRLSWTCIEKPDELIFGGQEGVITGIFKLGANIVSILDFEKIAFDINPDMSMKVSDITPSDAPERASRPILIAEDSGLLRKLIIQSLSAAGYTHIISTSDGEEAWNYLRDIKSHSDFIQSEVCCVITDIEMPKMDGHRLTKMIKSDPVLGVLPVIIFSSMIDENMEKKGLEVGADAQISKPEIVRLVGLLEQLIHIPGQDA